MPTTWQRGDRVRHAGRPEWGLGKVQSAESAVLDGKPCQRLVVAFDRVGTRTLSTAFADLRSADDAVPVSNDRPDSTDPLAMQMDQIPAEQRLVAVPEDASDPFASGRSRLAATLALYRFTDTGASLLDWAAMQTGMKDPLARFNRHELEQHFRRFQVNLDAHLKKLVRDLKRQEPATVQELTQSAGPAARQALRRADIGR